MHPFLRLVWNRLQWWWFLLFQRHRHRRLVLERIAGVPILVLPDVFNPKLFCTGAALARFLQEADLYPGMRILDMGAGSGVGAVFAARLGARVVAVDVNPEAVRCCRLNALLNRVEGQIEVREGDLFQPVRGERFDLVLFNPPFFPGQPDEAWEYAWRSDDAFERFAAGLCDILTPNGRALVILSSHMTGTMATLERHGLHWRLRWERRLIGERLTILELIP